MKAQSNDREARLAAALRANLKKRKARDRAVAQQGAKPAPEQGEISPPSGRKSGPAAR